MKKIIIALLMSLPVISYGQALQKELTGVMGHNEQQILALAEAIPDDKYGWAPEEGVRSVSGVLLHLASANYFFLSSMGFELPQGVDMKKIESITGKKEVIETVKKSFAYAKEKIPMITDKALDEKFKTPFGEFSKRSGILIMLDHSGEHKGQLIAYARMNGITPPWSKKEE